MSWHGAPVELVPFQPNALSGGEFGNVIRTSCRSPSLHALGIDGRRLRDDAETCQEDGEVADWLLESDDQRVPASDDAGGPLGLPVHDLLRADDVGVVSGQDKPHVRIEEAVDRVGDRPSRHRRTGREADPFADRERIRLAAVGDLRVAGREVGYDLQTLRQRLRPECHEGDAGKARHHGGAASKGVDRAKRPPADAERAALLDPVRARRRDEDERREERGCERPRHFRQTAARSSSRIDDHAACARDDERGRVVVGTAIAGAAFLAMSTSSSPYVR